jgi:hypothetical protein
MNHRLTYSPTNLSNDRRTDLVTDWLRDRINKATIWLPDYINWWIKKWPPDRLTVPGFNRRLGWFRDRVFCQQWASYLLRSYLNSLLENQKINQRDYENPLSRPILSHFYSLHISQYVLNPYLSHDSFK